MGTLQIQGSFQVPASEREEIIVTLPAAYGLGAGDRIMEDPGMFGHEDRTWRLKADANGAFTVTNIETVYHVTICLLPPLGAFPEQPPLPFYLIRFPQNEKEVYLVGPSPAGPAYKVLDPDSKAEIQPSQAEWILENLEYLPIDEGRGWLLKFSVSRNARTLSFEAPE